MQLRLSADELAAGVRRLAAEIHDYYHDRPLTILAVLTGSIVFVADLIRQLRLPLRLALAQASSYRGSATAPGLLQLNTSLLPDIADRDVLVVDDIFDTGHTLDRLLAELHSLRPASLRSMVLLRKQGRQEVDLEPDHVGFEIPNEFVVGYGLDYDDLYRNLPYLAVLDPDELRLAEHHP